MTYERVLRRIRPRKKEGNKKISVLDVETIVKDKTKIEPLPEYFRFGVVLDEDGTTHKFISLDAMREFLTSTTRHGKKYLEGRTFWAHYASGFDYVLLFPDMLTDPRWNVIMSGSKIVRASYKLHGKNWVHFCDSHNLLPTKLVNLGEAVGLPKLTMDYTNEGLPSEKEWEYCIRDCEIVMKALVRMRELCSVLRPTIAAQALSLFCRKYLPHNIYVSKLDDTFGESYYGGRVEAYHIGQCNDYCYDINSLYPFVMKNGRFPHPSYFVKRTNVNINDFLKILEKYEGNAVLKVEVKPCAKPILPVKYNGKLLFPCGRIQGRWNFPEIRLAMQYNQIRILSVDEVVYTTQSIMPFVNFVTDLYNLRMMSTNEADKLIYKFLLNSLYGKFAQRYREKTVYYKDSTYLTQAQEKYKNRIKRIQELKNGKLAITLSIDDEFARHDVVAWASYVTSYARVYNWQLQYVIENKYGINVDYTDTDSFFVSQPLPDSALIGKELGKLKLEDKSIKKINGPKDYAYITSDGKEKKKLKGVPNNAEQIDENTYRYNKVIRFKEGIRRGIQPGTSIEVKKILKRNYDKRIVMNDGSTMPIELRMF